MPPRPARPAGHRRLIDSHGRAIHDLRLSITDRCNFRCIYCMEPDARTAPSADLLTVPELTRAARACVQLGVDHIRLTGGEPTVHPHLTTIIESIAALGVADVSMTTNGSLITPRTLAEWTRAGLRRITFSLDAFRPETFEAITRSRSSPGRVRDSIEIALAAGLAPIKVNAVIIRGWNELEVPGLAQLARQVGFEMRFIEYMPLDEARRWHPELLVPASEILDLASRAGPLVARGRPSPDSTSEIYQFADLPADSRSSIGVIAPVTRPFCGRCSRLRITADGKIRPCLFSHDETDIRDLLRSGAADDLLRERLLDAVWAKQAGHGITDPGFRPPDRPMSAIGG
ncbi:MAG: GTP 3',8-cyclase MoaA [Phycisphaerales bacterium]|nr:GTP 3',8-cyclase MoaA [Phycisphaerales bacterium]